MLRRLQRAILVEDDGELRAVIALAIRRWRDLEIFEAGSGAEARALLETGATPDLLVVDVRLPDESVFGVLEAARELSPAPIVVAMSGKASPDETFRLARYGVRAFVPKPFSIQELASAIESACQEAPDLEPLITAYVGRVPMRELQREVRRVMVKEALALTEGSRSGAARLLQVTRQAVQQMLRAEEDSRYPAKSSDSAS